jgi:hypothetical protein
LFGEPKNSAHAPVNKERNRSGCQGGDPRKSGHPPVNKLVQPACPGSAHGRHLVNGASQPRGGRTSLSLQPRSEPLVQSGGIYCDVFRHLRQLRTEHLQQRSAGGGSRSITRGGADSGAVGLRAGIERCHSVFGFLSALAGEPGCIGTAGGLANSPRGGTCSSFVSASSYSFAAVAPASVFPNQLGIL